MRDNELFANTSCDATFANVVRRIPICALSLAFLIVARFDRLPSFIVVRVNNARFSTLPLSFSRKSDVLTNCLYYPQEIIPRRKPIDKTLKNVGNTTASIYCPV